VTLGEAVGEAARRLRDADIATDRLDARMLVGHVVGIAPGTLLGRDDYRLSEVELDLIGELVARRTGREPISRILGEREFWSLMFKIDSEVLIPRPESEILVEAALEYGTCRDGPLRILDLGTGSGCLLLALLTELPNADGVGIDVSNRALDVARANAQSIGLGQRAQFLDGDWCDGVSGNFNIVVCNPPYIPEEAIDALDPEVAAFEPRLALSGGKDGLAAYRRVAPELTKVLVGDGMAFFEIGAGAVVDVAAVFQSAGLHIVDIRSDLADIPRCVCVAGKTIVAD
jgi:release factor glutamine methyltransferase